MKVQFNRMERMAGLFVLTAVGAFLGFIILVAIKQGWFSARHTFRTTFAHGDGLHSGTQVQIAGLKAGRIDDVYLSDDNIIEVVLSVRGQFKTRIRQDSLARVVRPFVIGDKVVQITVGSANSPMVKDGNYITSEETMDIMDLIGGGKLGPYLETIDSLLGNLKFVAEAFADPKRSKLLIGMFDEMLPTMLHIQNVSEQMTKYKRLGKVMKNMSQLTIDVNKMLPAMTSFAERLPRMGELGEKTLAELSTLTSEMNKVLPVLAEIAPQLPAATQKSVRAMEEALIVLRAMQKSFLLSGAVEDVLEEDAEKRKALKAEREKLKKEEELKAAREKEKINDEERAPASDE